MTLDELIEALLDARVADPELGARQIMCLIEKATGRLVVNVDDGDGEEYGVDVDRLM